MKMNNDNTEQALIMLGWKEWVELPDLGIKQIKAKVDTGARTSALHTYFAESYSKGSERWVKFGIHPLQGDTETHIICDTPLLEERNITNSGGQTEKRFVIETTLLIGGKRLKVEMTLTNRDSMKFRMLIGRTSMNGIFCVNPEAAHLT